MAADPSLSQADMQEIAATRPDLLPALASNPALYPGLRQWLRTHPDPAVKDALARGAENAHTVRADQLPSAGAPQTVTPPSSPLVPTFAAPESYPKSPAQPPARPAPTAGTGEFAPRASSASSSSPLEELLDSAPREAPSLSSPFSHIPSTREQPPPKKSGGKVVAIVLVILVVIAVIVFFVAKMMFGADGTDSGGQAIAPTVPTQQAEPTAAPPETYDPVEPTPEPVETANTIVKPAPAGALNISGFSSATGNLQCQFTSNAADQDLVKCTIWEYEFEPDVNCTEPGAPITYELYAQGPVNKRCTYTDTVEGMPTAEYETAMAQNGFACTLETYNGFTCWSEESGEGFQIRKRWDRVF